ncbi:unnamed protein product [Durusdinium trenchii]|uniref:Uncharacterized protein n=1 Tax=Durusdinium trenchii TaxID=1381693 RepID=A0ABP0HEK1_9DINO
MQPKKLGRWERGREEGRETAEANDGGQQRAPVHQVMQRLGRVPAGTPTAGRDTGLAQQAINSLCSQSWLPSGLRPGQMSWLPGIEALCGSARGPTGACTWEDVSDLNVRDFGLMGSRTILRW